VCESHEEWSALMESGILLSYFMPRVFTHAFRSHQEEEKNQMKKKTLMKKKSGYSTKRHMWGLFHRSYMAFLDFT
jgi:hypothetical protein